MFVALMLTLIIIFLNVIRNSESNAHVASSPSHQKVFFGALVLSSHASMRCCFNGTGDGEARCMKAINNSYHIKCFSCEDCDKPFSKGQVRFYSIKSILNTGDSWLLSLIFTLFPYSNKFA
jgi:hypothetical protein